LFGTFQNYFLEQGPTSTNAAFQVEHQLVFGHLNQGPGSSSRNRRDPLWFRGTPRLIPTAVILGGNCTDQDAVQIVRTPRTDNLFDWLMAADPGEGWGACGSPPETIVKTG